MHAGCRARPPFAGALQDRRRACRLNCGTRRRRMRPATAAHPAKDEQTRASCEPAYRLAADRGSGGRRRCGHHRHRCTNTRVVAERDACTADAVARRAAHGCHRHGPRGFDLRAGAAMGSAARRADSHFPLDCLRGDRDAVRPAVERQAGDHHRCCVSPGDLRSSICTALPCSFPGFRFRAAGSPCSPMSLSAPAWPRRAASSAQQPAGDRCPCAHPDRSATRRLVRARARACGRAAPASPRPISSCRYGQRCYWRPPCQRAWARHPVC